MAGRPRQYADNAEKARAYRARRAALVVEADREWFEDINARLYRLLSSVASAARAGDPIAASVRISTCAELLESLAVYFERQAQGSADSQAPPGPTGSGKPRQQRR